MRVCKSAVVTGRALDAASPRVRAHGPGAGHVVSWHVVIAEVPHVCRPAATAVRLPLSASVYMPSATLGARGPRAFQAQIVLQLATIAIRITPLAHHRRTPLSLRCRAQPRQIEKPVHTPRTCVVAPSGLASGRGHAGAQQVTVQARSAGHSCGYTPLVAT